MIRTTSRIVLLLALVACGGSEPPPKEDAAASSPAPEQEQKDVRALLQGQWVSDEDSQSHVEFRGDSVFDWYGAKGSPGESGVFAVGEECDDGNGISKPDARGTMLHMNGSCYSIQSVDSLSLSLTYLARGNTLRYNRVKQ